MLTRELSICPITFYVYVFAHYVYENKLNDLSLLALPDCVYICYLNYCTSWLTGVKVLFLQFIFGTVPHNYSSNGGIKFDYCYQLSLLLNLVVVVVI